MLQFNPYLRTNVDDALAHPFFTKVKKPHKEKLSESQITLDFENETLDRDRLRQLFVETILGFKNQQQQ